MGSRIKGSTIEMIRGDSLKAKINIENANGEKYIPAEGDRIRFAAKKEYTDIDPCILKEIPYDTLLLCLEPDDTKNLDMPSTYLYDIQITMSDGTVDTFIRGQLKIKEEID